MSYLYIPFLLQGLLMGVDESLHAKRGLGKWERLGHPLDTLTVFAPLLFVALTEFTEVRMTLFVVMAIASCFFITKDEFIHTKECSPFENWLHACLFVLHPMIFFCTGIIWKYDGSNIFLKLQPLMVGLFMIYQILRWSIPWQSIRK